MVQDFVIASGLSEDTNHTVLVLEAGTSRRSHTED